MGVFSIAAITQFLAIFGIANEINVLVWMIGLEAIGGLVSVGLGIMMFMAYDSAYTIANDSGSSAGDVTNAEAVMAGVWNDWVKSIIDGMISEQVLWAYGPAWLRYNEKMSKKGDMKKEGDKMDGPMEGGERPPRDGPQLFSELHQYIAF